MVIVVAPLIVTGAVVVYFLGWAVRLRWWWPTFGGVIATVAIFVAFGLEGLVARYAGGYRNLFDGVAVLGLGGALTSGWTAYLGVLAPVSLSLAAMFGGLALAYGEFWCFSWRQVPRSSSRKARQTCRRLERGLVFSGVLSLGVDVESGLPIRLGEVDLFVHVLVVGVSRSGKTIVLLSLVKVVISWDRLLVFIDLKGDPVVVERLWGEAEVVGKVFWCWSLEGGACWNLFAYGDPSELKDKLVGLETWTELYYRWAVERYLQLVFGVLVIRVGGVPMLSEVVALLVFYFLGALVRRLEGEAGDVFFAYVNFFIKDQQSVVAGLAICLVLFIESIVGSYLFLGERSLDLRHVIGGSGVVVFSLDSGRWPGLSAQVGALVVQDLKAICGAALHSSDLHGFDRAFYVVIDEFSVLDVDQVLGLVVRGAVVGCSVIFSI
jgi:hypothetical protein